MMKIDEIKSYTTCYEDVNRGECHESLLRSYHAIHKILEMTARGDSKETILEVAEILGYKGHASN